MDLKRKINLKLIVLNSRVFRKRSLLGKTPILTGAKKIIQEATKKASKTRIVPTKKVYTNNRRP